jgi:DNA-binding CsgD family transcriptional regulator
LQPRPLGNRNLMTWREVCEADLIECLNIEPRHLGDEIVGSERAIAIWKKLIRSRSFHSSVIEYITPAGDKRIVDFGASVFVTADFVDRELENPQPYLNSRLLASVATGDSVVIPETSLCHPDVSKPLDVVIFGGNSPTRKQGLTPDQAAQAAILLPFSFEELHVGYRLNRILTETISEPQRNLYESSVVWRTFKTYPEHDRALVVMTREQALAVSGSVAASLFMYQEPVLRLRDTEKHLLSEAMHGETDAELAAKLNLSLSTVKKRWNSLFARIAEVRPDLLPDADTRENESRGLQKRHHILAYVRAHPQEVRPYRWRSFKQV